MLTGETNISNYSEFYEEWDDDEQWVECTDCYGTGLDRDEIYDCMTCAGEGEIRIYPVKNSLEISIPQPLTDDVAV